MQHHSSDSASVGRAGGLALRGIVKDFGRTRVLDGVDLDIHPGEFLTLVGPSGCGKSTLLRIIAGLEIQSAGTVSIAGRPVDHLRPSERDVAMVFQSYALYPHMSVAANIASPLELRRLKLIERLPILRWLSPRRARVMREIMSEVRAMAEQLQLTALLDRRPAQLSGGQRQRVALGRAMVRQPLAFLMDEPLSNLDAKLRVLMRTELAELHARLAATFVYVTHDQVEAMTLADFVVVMNKGRIEQIGTPQELYRAPQTRFVAGFIGSPTMNFIACRLEQGGGGLRVVIDGGPVLPVPPDRTARYGSHVGKPMLLGLRPEHLTEPRLPQRADTDVFDITVDVIEPLGMETMVFFRLGAVPVCARVDPAVAPGAGERIKLMAHLSHMHLIDPQTDAVV